MFVESTTNRRYSRCPCMNFKLQLCLSCAACESRHCDLQAPVDSKDMDEVKDILCFRGVGAFEIASLSINSLSDCLPGLT